MGSRGIERWAERSADGEAWFAQVEAESGSTTTLSKAEYEAKSLAPSFWSLRKKQHSYSTIVADGMKRISADFSSRLVPLGFKKASAKRWVRAANDRIDEIAIERSGSSYGAPGRPSIDLRVWLSVRPANVSVDKRVSLRCDKVRRPNGYAYHHRFNSQTSSTYERCLDELVLFVTEFAEGWFADPSPEREQSNGG